MPAVNGESMQVNVHMHIPSTVDDDGDCGTDILPSRFAMT